MACKGAKREGAPGGLVRGRGSGCGLRKWDPKSGGELSHSMRLPRLCTALSRLCSVWSAPPCWRCGRAAPRPEAYRPCLLPKSLRIDRWPEAIRSGRLSSPWARRAPCAEHSCRIDFLPNQTLRLRYTAGHALSGWWPIKRGSRLGMSYTPRGSCRWVSRPEAIRIEPEHARDQLAFAAAERLPSMATARQAGCCAWFACSRCSGRVNVLSFWFRLEVTCWSVAVLSLVGGVTIVASDKSPARCAERRLGQ